MNKPKVLIFALLLMFTPGCSLLQTDIELRKHVFQEHPIWESQTLQDLQVSPSDEESLVSTQLPGLSMLIHQVLAEKIAEKEPGAYEKFTEDIKTLTTNDAEYEYFTANTLKVLKDDQPLPPEIADNPVTKALIWTLASNSSASLFKEDVRDRWILPNLELSTKDFESFVKQLTKSVVIPFHEPFKVDKQNRHFKIQTFGQDMGVNWEGLFNAYLMAYYNGKFVDRTGGEYSKPKLGLTITNETITAFISIFLEALFDYVIVAGNEFRVPVVYEPTSATDDKPVKWLPTGKQPTLAKVVKELTGEHELTYVVEPVKKSGEEGITKKKLCVIHAISGITGDAAQGASGTILRLFGGGTGGIAFLNGKVSIGDNETLAKVIDTLLENSVKRLTEMFISHTLYSLTYDEVTHELTIKNPTQAQLNAWGILKSRLDISKLVGCFI